MSCLGSSIIAGASGQGVTDYAIERSLRFNSADSAYLNRTPSSASNRKTWTWSGWVKRSKLGVDQFFLACVESTTIYSQFGFNSDDTLRVQFKDSSANSNNKTSAVFRDTSAWYHIVFHLDTTQSAASSRMRTWVNGVEQTFSDDQRSSITQDGTYSINTSSSHLISSHSPFASGYLDCYLAEVYLIDGQALAPADFGETDDNGVWQPKRYTGGYSTSGSHTPATYNSSRGNDIYSWEFANIVDDSLSTYGSPNGRTVGFNYSTSNNPTINIKVRPGPSLQITIRPEVNGNLDYSGGNWVGTSSNTKTFSSNTTVETGFTLPANYTGTFQVYMSSSSAASQLDIYDIGGTAYPEPNNSFYLKFNDNSSNSALGTDSSGMNNTWTVNNLVAYYAPIYSNDITYTNTYYGNFDATFAFDGSITTSTYTSGGGDSIYYNPSNPLTYSSKVEFYISWGMDIKINGGSFVSYSPTGWNTIATGSGTITSLEVRNQTGGYGRWIALRVDGVILIDGTGVPPASVDCLLDSPSNGAQTDTGTGGQVSGNYCTLLPLDKNGSVSTSNGNLEATISASVSNVICGSLQVTSGKWYWEASMTSATKAMIGVGDGSQKVANRNFQNEGWYYFSETGNKYHDNTNASYGAIYGQNDVIGVALDMDAGTLTFYKNGVSQGVAYNTDLSGLSIVPCLGNASSGGTSTVVFNFGQRAFAHAAPSGYKALCTTNLPDPTVEYGSQYFDAKVWTGNGSTQTISGYNFTPDLVWMKSRSDSGSAGLFDTIRGATKRIKSDTNIAEQTKPQTLTSFNSDGYSLGNDASYNYNNRTFVGWAWDAGTSTVSNTDGTTTSQVRANPSAGVSIVSWSSASGSAPTIGHGLNKKPEYIIAKCYNTSGNWYVYEPSMDTSGTLSKTLRFDTNGALTTTTGIWGHVDRMTSTTFGVYNSNGYNNKNNMIAYCFTSVEGYSAMGDYVGNNSTNGPFIYTGFRPAFVMIKVKSGATNDWAVFDNKREGYNSDNSFVVMNDNDDEDSSKRIDLLSNGFQCVAANTLVNGSNDSYIYLAFAEHPIKYARAR